MDPASYERTQFYRLLFSCPTAARILFVELGTLGRRFALERRVFVTRVAIQNEGIVFPSEFIVRSLEDVQRIVFQRELVPLCLEFSGVVPGHFIQGHGLFPTPQKHLPGVWLDKPRECDREYEKQGVAAWFGEVVLDVDLSDDIYNRRGLCACFENPQCCDVCWKAFILPALVVMEHLLRDVFQMHGYFFVFSGRRGVHCWIVDRRVVHWTREQRASFMQGIQNYTSDRVAALLKLLYQDCVPLMRQNSSPSREELFSKLYPKFDTQVTLDAKHNRKLPLMLHPSTGFLCVPFDNVREFVPSQNLVPVFRVTQEMLERGASIIERALERGKA